MPTSHVLKHVWHVGKRGKVVVVKDLLLLFCRVRCELSMNHARDGVHHKITSTRCNYSPSHDNRIFLCKVVDAQNPSCCCAYYGFLQTCYNRGIETTVFPKTSSTSNAGWIGLAKYAWTGYISNNYYYIRGISHPIIIRT